MTTARDVANYLLTKSDPGEGDTISNLKLQKLVYYAQGLHLALFDRPLFDEQIVAWAHGPVVPDLYHAFKAYEAGAIPLPDGPPVITAGERELLDEIWTVYGQFSAWKLRNMTHAEPPWTNTEQSSEISRDRMSEYFKTLLTF